ncbi:Omega-3 fatty acid desaturase [Heracleum sosnowskyi]|uniref:Omega-3 fatty acid desaturase n=1 Tax=Heracleum sosnowskyi TaxID=360622 RepID=A0AAD8HXI4_9APIA|nr:Omega-3 fatty acid desaturase [Heracleum sosnowskyi]
MNGDAALTSAPNPPFKIEDIRAAIPKHCWIKNPWRSLSYVLRDFILAFGLMGMAVYIDSWIFWPLYWTAQGSVFMGLFVIGHDCGHGSFSDNRMLNNVMGHVLLTFVLTPFHGFRIGHRTHHQNHGHADKDEAWVPLPENIYKNLDSSTKFLRFTIPFPLLAHPLYLLYRSPGKDGSHFNPNTELFLPSERSNVFFSTVCWSLMFVLLLVLSVVIGPVQMIKLYWIPYWVLISFVVMTWF